MRQAGDVPRSDVFYAIAHPARRRLLDRLGKAERTATSLANPFRMTRPAVANHLRILRKAGLVKVRREGRERHYRLVPHKLKTVHDWVTPYQRFWTEGLTKLGEYLDRTP
jgi:DNA-binding transcriptional ArsR family regulator